jgi:hypothetical protein
MTTGEAIRNFCKQCVSSSLTKVIRECGGEYVKATQKPSLAGRKNLQDNLKGKVSAL